MAICHPAGAEAGGGDVRQEGDRGDEARQDRQGRPLQYDGLSIKSIQRRNQRLAEQDFPKTPNYPNSRNF